jgi:hypothetical protein
MKDIFQIILFKNNKKKKIFKSFKTKKNANSYFESKMKKSNRVKFKTLVENGVDVDMRLAIVSNTSNNDYSQIYYTDELGRQIIVNPKIGENLYIQKISQYNEEELIYDIKENKKIDIDFFIKKYLSEKELYMLSKLNNKLIVQKNENTQLFSFKNENDVGRFVDSLTNSMDKINFIYVSDVSSAQKKYLYKLLEESGFDKQMLYRKSTTHPKQR